MAESEKATHPQRRQRPSTHWNRAVYPSFPEDAKGLLISSINDPNPVMFFEHKALYRSCSELVSKDYFNVEIGKARLVREGSDVTIISYGLAVHWALDILDNNKDISADLIDLRTLIPLDEDLICNSVMRTGRVIILQEDTLIGGFASDIASLLADKCFEFLDAPIKRVASLDTPIPFSTNLEEEFLAKSRFEKQLKDLLEY